VAEASLSIEQTCNDGRQAKRRPCGLRRYYGRRDGNMKLTKAEIKSYRSDVLLLFLTIDGKEVSIVGQKLTLFSEGYVFE
jgi:hypothetical protein